MTSPYLGTFASGRSLGVKVMHAHLVRPLGDQSRHRGSIVTSRSLVWYAAHAFDQVPEESALIASHAKSHLSEVGRFVARTSTEVHGGMGFTDLAGLHYWFKRIGLDRQLLGGPETVRTEAARLQGWIAA